MSDSSSSQSINTPKAYFDLDWGWRYLYQWFSITPDSTALSIDKFQAANLPFPDYTREKGLLRFNRFLRDIREALNENLDNIKIQDIDSLLDYLGFLKGKFSDTEDFIFNELGKLSLDLLAAKYKKHEKDEISY